MKFRRTSTTGIPILLAALLTAGAIADESADEPILDALASEVERAMDALGEREAAPYFIGVELLETQAVHIVAEAGGLHGYSPSRNRWLDVDLRIGSRALDSSHALRSGGERARRAGHRLPLSDDPELIRHAVWLEIDRRYQAARERWAKVEAESKVLVEEEPAEDLAQVKTVRFVGPVSRLDYEPQVWERRVKEASRVLVDHPVTIEAISGFSGSAETRWYVSSEGTRVRHGESRYRTHLNVQTIAEDGESLRLYHSFDAHSADGLPDRETIVAGARALVETLAKQRIAPLEEPYAGPAILSGRAAGVFFHEVFGHRVEGHRLKRVDNAQTFRNRVGQQILPSFLSVYDDPTRPQAAGTDLRGHYRFDNQGVPSERVVLVENGVLRGFLQSRSPVARGDRSNGHGRRQRGNDPVSRQGSLIVETSEAASDEELRRELIQLAREQGREYGLYIDDIQGGFTFIGRTIPNAFNVNAVQTHRVYVDGRPDEQVRGVDLIGTPLEAFSKIIRAGRQVQVFNGSCGAESGMVPVSAVAPHLLLRSIETQRKRKDQKTPPLLPAPRPKLERGRSGEVQ